MNSVWAKQKAFTIVELLIVIVVIAILAAITIVAYNGIQDRAKASAAQAAAKQASTKIQAYLVENAENYPASPAAAGLSATSGTTYEYRYDNAANPRTFCLTATTNNVSYYVSNTTTTPTAGACSGHGVNGVAAITNLATNPSVESNITGWNSCSGCSTSRIGGALYGSYAARATATSTGNRYIYLGVNSASDMTVSEGQTITASATVQNQLGGTRQFRLNLVWRASNGTAVGNVDGANTSLVLGASTRLTVTGIVPSGVGVSYVQVQGLTEAAQINDAWDWDGVMVTSGSASGVYADGSSPGWIWNGTPNNSTSTGPPL